MLKKVYFLHENWQIGGVERTNIQWLKILKENGIPEDFKYLTAIESGFSNVVSPKNAVGFWQILSTSGKENGLEINKYVDERYDPIKSTEAFSELKVEPIKL